ncbi:DUF6431 domain-containing protein [Sporolactobacillus sp. THM19-2]|uniref:DUF6431 domain-containing protein n=1 Tax=Sporolactobacillus sp. THM19-2 TaxID=2511171 RepID=UPI001F0D8E1D|nr:DUF6431 domain-containing protein [Sporolactobacillus sp. THM19-2]
MPCPCCGEKLNVIGSRRRNYRERSGEKKVLVIRRLRCTDCQKIHHELPDFLVPYKRYQADCLEKALSEPETCDIAADNAMIYRWEKWFCALADYWINCLHAIHLCFQLEKDPVNPMPTGSLTVLEQLGQIVSTGSGWLSRMTRPIANVNLWVQTRPTFLSE